MRRRTPLLLVLVGVAHCALGVSQGFEDGDFGLLYVAAPLVALTLLAAAAAATHRPFGRWAAVALTSLTAAMAVALLSAYGIGLFHLPQAVVATVLAARAAADPD